MQRIHLSPSNKLTSDDRNEPSFNLDVGVVFEENSGIFGSNPLQLGCILVNKKSLPLRNIDQVPVNWQQVDAPGSDITPSQGVDKPLPDDCFFSSDMNLKY